MLLVLIIVWAVVVGGCLGYALVAGFRTFRRVRAAQATLESRIAVLSSEGLVTLEERTAELNVKMVKMQASLERLEQSLDALSILTVPVSGLATALVALRRILRR
jgi:hypothetical protein